MKADEETIKRIYELLDSFPKPTLDDIIGMAIQQHQVKKGRQQYVRAVVETAFKYVLESKPKGIKSE